MVISDSTTVEEFHLFLQLQLTTYQACIKVNTVSALHLEKFKPILKMVLVLSEDSAFG